MDEILTLKQVANLLHFSTRTVYRLVKRRALNGRRIGGQWRFLKSDILALFKKKHSKKNKKKHRQKR